MSGSKDELGVFLETAMAPSIVRCLHPGARHADYMQQLLEAARDEKEAGNTNFKSANVHHASRHYGKRPSSPTYSFVLVAYNWLLITQLATYHLSRLTCDMSLVTSYL